MMEKNNEIYLAKACKLVESGTYDFKYKRCETYDEEIIVIEAGEDTYKEIITGITFKKYPKSFNEVNSDDVYVILSSRIDNLKEGYDIIRNYYEERNEMNIYHMFDWFNMDEHDRIMDSRKRNDKRIFDYTAITNDLVKRKMKQK